MKKKKILITGAGGMIGSDLRELLEEDCEVYSGDLVRLKDAARPVVCDIRDPAGIRAACRGMDAVVHLAAAAWDYDTHGVMIPVNIAGTTNVFDAAHKEGVKCVIFASSHHAISLHHARDEENLTETTELNPSTYYGVTKVFGEALGRLYSEKHGMRVYCLRIGLYLGAQRMRNRKRISRVHEAIPLSPRDFKQMVSCCLNAEGVPYAVLNCVSQGRRPWLDLSRAKHLVGYEPADTFESLFGADAPVQEFDGEAYRANLLSQDGEGRFPDALKE